MINLFLEIIQQSRQVDHAEGKLIVMLPKMVSGQ